MNKTQSTKAPIGAKSILIGIVAIFIFSLLFSSVINLFSKYIAIKKHINTLKQEQSTLEQKKENVTSMNEYIDTPDGQEQIFRDKYRLVKPGEGMIVITNDEDNQYQSQKKKPIVERFWESVKKGLGLQ